MGEHVEVKGAHAEVSPLLADLREKTKDLHAAAERHPVQAAMVRGQLGVDGYTAYLCQMWRIHTALEEELGRRLGSPVLAPVTADQFRADAIIEDLAALDRSAVDPAVEPVAGFVASVPRLSDAELLGMQYVLEGSTNGGRFIAMAVRKGLGLDGDRGTRYLDPYGEAQKARWGAFCAAMSGLASDDETDERVVLGAEAMFRLIIETFDAMQTTAG